MLIRYSAQREAEHAIAAMDRAYVFGCWCRARKAQPLSNPNASKLVDMTQINLVKYRGTKITRADVCVNTSAAHGPIPRDNWKRLLTMASEYGDVEILYGDASGVLIGYGDKLKSGQKCIEQIGGKKLLGKSVTVERRFEIDEFG